MTRDIAAIIDMIETFPSSGSHAEVIRIAQERLNLEGSICCLPIRCRRPAQGPSSAFSTSFSARRSAARSTCPSGSTRWEIPTSWKSACWMEDQVLRVLRAAARPMPPTRQHLPVVDGRYIRCSCWRFAVAFLAQFRSGRSPNLPRPPKVLARAGRCRPASSRAARSEVRRAGVAFLRMRERIERQIEQRTAMLTGVSHDCARVLTRFKLQLASGRSDGRGGRIESGISTTCSRCSRAIWLFARGEAAEDAGSFDLAACLDKLSGRGAAAEAGTDDGTGRPVRGAGPPDRVLAADGQCGRQCHPLCAAFNVSARNMEGRLVVCVDDDGPGIPADRREDVFKPFLRGLNERGTRMRPARGLGLSIARDIARSHGGDITLEASPLGGLRATIRVPA